jgi:hypothetical protein
MAASSGLTATNHRAAPGPGGPGRQATLAARRTFAVAGLAIPSSFRNVDHGATVVGQALDDVGVHGRLDVIAQVHEVDRVPHVRATPSIWAASSH